MMTTTPAISSPLLNSTTLADTSAAASTRDKLAGVAKQFEAIFLRQMMSAARKTDFGESLFSGDQGMSTFKQMQDERFADIASDTGAFGLAKMIEMHLARFVDAGNAATATTADTTTNQQEAPTNGL